jgi:Predicted integral membrane protein (DUF2270)
VPSAAKRYQTCPQRPLPSRDSVTDSMQPRGVQLPISIVVRLIEVQSGAHGSPTRRIGRLLRWESRFRPPSLVPRRRHYLLYSLDCCSRYFSDWKSRRYRYFNVWRARVRWPKVYFYAPILTGELLIRDQNWRTVVARDCTAPRQHITFWRAM